jgi:hypothetical protein
MEFSRDERQLPFSVVFDRWRRGEQGRQFLGSGIAGCHAMIRMLSWVSAGRTPSLALQNTAQQLRPEIGTREKTRSMYAASGKEGCGFAARESTLLSRAELG